MDIVVLVSNPIVNFSPGGKLVKRIDINKAGKGKKKERRDLDYGFWEGRFFGKKKI